MDYELLMNKSDFYQSKAIKLFQQGQIDLANFYNHVSRGYKIRARNLCLGCQK